jgi:hypothetical protein
LRGDWRGVLQPTMDFRIELRVILKVRTADGGGWKALFYSVNQGGSPIPVTSITLDGFALNFSVKQLQGSYEGKVTAGNSSIVGKWSQNGAGRRRLVFQRPAVAERITADGLERMLAADKGKPDGKIAEQLSGLELSERLSAARLSRCETGLSGPQAKQALLALADRAAFLDLPAGDIPVMAMPDAATQREMIAATLDYVLKTTHQLPNLFATRVTTSFEDNPWEKKSLHLTGKSGAIVLYRDGREVQQPRDFALLTAGLTTSGEFGPVMGTAILDAGQGNLKWSHWEQGKEGQEAVYRYAVDALHSHYEVQGWPAAYRGEIAVNSVNGTIFRLVFRADLEPNDALDRADMVVEFGPVELGNKTYICPLKGVASSQELESRWLNDVAFEQYHLFRGTARMLPGFNQDP